MFSVWVDEEVDVFRVLVVGDGGATAFDEKK